MSQNQIVLNNFRKICPDKKDSQILQQLKTYYQSFDDAQFIKKVMKVTGLSKNYYMLSLKQKLTGHINFNAFSQIQFKLVQYIHISLEQFSCQQVQLFMKSIPKSFPNLKVFQIVNGKYFSANHWKILINNISKLVNIEALNLFNIKVQHLQIEELNKLKLIKQLRFLVINTEDLNKQSQNNLQKFYVNNPQYYH